MRKGLIFAATVDFFTANENAGKEEILGSKEEEEKRKTE